jgi:predicted ATPase
VGPNASGKSNLLDALRLLSAWVSQPSLAAGFTDHRGTPLEAFHRSDRTMEQMRDQRALTMSLEADVRLSAGTIAEVARSLRDAGKEGAAASITHDYLRYRVQVQLTPASGRLRVLDERLLPLRRDGKPKASRLPFLSPEEVDGAGSETRLHLRREAGGHPYFHELGLDHTILSEPLYPPHFAHAVAFREELKRWRIHAFHASSIRDGAPWGATGASGSGQGLAGFLHRLAAEHPSELSRLTDRLRSLVPFVDGLQVESDAEGRLQLRIVEQGVPVSARLASSGTLRLLALLAAVSPHAGASLVALEEPERSVHRRRLPVLADLLREATENSDRQILLNTHSLAFARLFDDASIRLFDRRGAATHIEPFDPAYAGLFRDAAIEEAIESH